MSSVKTRKLDISTILAVVRAQNSAGSIDSWTLNTATEDIYNNNNSGKVAINKDTANYTLDVSGNFKANIIIDKNNSSGVPGQFLSTNGDELEWKAGSGTQGPQGDAGPAGGPQGNQGSQGTQGVQGSQGTQGSQGSQGNIGNTGSTGLQGYQGNQGWQGITGAGFQGYQGWQGTSGPAGGPQGSQGPQGWQGVKGDTGSTGSQGSAGLQGTQGWQGVVGNTGSTGLQGAQGIQGTEGSQGPQGWQGVVGNTGTQGPQGFQGDIGDTGVQGYQGSQGWQGDTGIGDIGPQGPQGNQGWQGVTGSTGSQGPQGRQGWQGVQGPQGNTGSTGVQGPQGNQGRQGNQGWQGVAAGSNAINVYSTATFTPSADNTAEKFPLNTSITSVYNSGFSATFTNDRITYTGTTANFLISVQLNGGQNTSGTVALGFEIRKNGTVIAGSPRGWQLRYFSGSQYLPPACSQIVTSLANTNYIEVFCTCSSIASVTPAAFTGYTPTGLNTMPTISVYIEQIS